MRPEAVYYSKELSPSQRRKLVERLDWHPWDKRKEDGYRHRCYVSMFSDRWESCGKSPKHRES